MNLLEDARERIDRIDREMASLFEQRMAAVEDVVRYKAQNDLPVLDASREAAVVQKNTAYLQNEKYKPYYEDFIRCEMAISRRYQAWMLGRDVVAYQGVEGAFTHIALTQLFPRAKAQACATWEDVFQAVEQDQAAYGVLPFENSSAGDVSQVLDLLFAHDLYIVNMHDLPVQQNLLALPGATLSGIRTVYSHPQALSQSEKFLRGLKVESISYPNTAMAAKLVADSGDLTKAAIASTLTAQLYGLQILVEGVNTEGTNTTRFIVIGKHKSNEGNRFSMLFTVDHKAGALARVIQAIGAAGLNMECIKSRPMPHVPFEYYFYVELVGSPDQANMQELMQQLNAICRTVRILGIFTR